MLPMATWHAAIYSQQTNLDLAKVLSDCKKPVCIGHMTECLLRFYCSVPCSLL